MQSGRPILRAILALSLSCPAAAAAQLVDAAGADQACVAPADRNRAMSSFTEAQRLELIACANRYAARQINARTPMRVDDLTTLESVATAGATAIYNQRVNMDAAEITAPMKASLDQAVRNNVCGTEQMRTTISYGGAYTYIWIDRSGTFIHRLDIRRC